MSGPTFYLIITESFKLWSLGCLTQPRHAARDENTQEWRMLAHSVSLFSLRSPPHTDTHTSTLWTYTPALLLSSHTIRADTSFLHRQNVLGQCFCCCPKCFFFKFVFQIIQSSPYAPHSNLLTNGQTWNKFPWISRDRWALEWVQGEAVGSVECVRLFVCVCVWAWQYVVQLLSARP